MTVAQSAADEAERLVVSKMKRQDYINVYVEDASDWKGNMELRGRLYRKQILTFRACQIQSLVANSNDVMDFIGASGLLTSFLLTNLVVRFTPLHSEMII